MKYDWPSGPTSWVEDRVLNVSIPFTWNLPTLLTAFQQQSFWWDRIEVGGPAVSLLPSFFDSIEYVSIGKSSPDVLGRIHPEATRTTIGCPRSCNFCAIGVGLVEPEFIELPEWDLRPVLMDNNLLAASAGHVEGVMLRLATLGAADFNQGLDARLLTENHARMIAEIKAPVVRLALDNVREKDAWGAAFDRLRTAGVAKSKIRSYCMVGFDSDPAEAWERCRWVEDHGIKAAPMWFHELYSLEKNIVTTKQSELGWTDFERRKIMQWFYKHKHAVA